jgi:hypothetical protein
MEGHMQSMQQLIMNMLELAADDLTMSVINNATEANVGWLYFVDDAPCDHNPSMDTRLVVHYDFQPDCATFTCYPGDAPVHHSRRDKRRFYFRWGVVTPPHVVTEILNCRAVDGEYKK